MSTTIRTHKRRDGTELTWGGRGGSVCTHCDLVFSGVTAFDRHLARPARGAPALHLDPLEAGLEQDRHGKWRLPASPMIRALEHEPGRLEQHGGAR